MTVAIRDLPGLDSESFWPLLERGVAIGVTAFCASTLPVFGLVLFGSGGALFGTSITFGGGDETFGAGAGFNGVVVTLGRGVTPGFVPMGGKVMVRGASPAAFPVDGCDE